MTTTYANRGKAFEDLLDYTNQIYANKGIALINKRPTPVQILRTKGSRITNAIYTKKSTVDYDGIYKGKPITFEAKSTNGKSLPLSMIPQHQVDYLLDADKHGAITFFIVHFKELDKTYIISTYVVSRYIQGAKNGGRKSIPIKEFEDSGIEAHSRNGIPLDYLKEL